MTADCSVYRHIILGSGPAGLTAGIYAARSNCCPLLIQGHQPGGQLTSTTAVDNFPGFPDGVQGPDLMQAMEKQARRFNLHMVTGSVSRIDLSARPFKVWVDDQCYAGRTLIICTGASPRMLGLPNEWQLVGRGVSVCATCDGFFYRDKEVVVVGGGDTAMEEALFLARFATRVTVVHRRDTLRATLAMQEKVRSNERIALRFNTQLVAILGDQQSGVTGARLKNLVDGTEEDWACDGIFYAIGHTPNTELFSGLLELDDYGYIVTHNHSETSLTGVFAAGDVQDPEFRQAITAAGSGCMAAIQAERFLETQEEETCGLKEF